jgi:uncharacterized protein involved in exopolysaccharide biosynthesis
MSPDRAPLLPDAPAAAPATQPSMWAAPRPASAGWLEVALPLWHRRRLLLGAMLLCATLAFGISLTRPVRYLAQASFVAQPSLRPSAGAATGALPALAGLVGAAGASPVDLHVAILRSQAVGDRIIERFELQRAWQLQTHTEVLNRVGRRVSFGIGRRDGVVQVSVEDENAQRAAAMANEYVAELRIKLRAFALEDAHQRRQFYEAQLAMARSALDKAQKQLQGSGFDRAALRTEPRAAAEAYGRLQAEVSAAELRLQATRRLRAEASPEVQQASADLAALRGQLAKLEVPHDDSGQGGAFVSRVREFRYAETLAESIARQAEGARVDEASDPLVLQTLDPATVPEFPASPRPLVWLLVGAVLGLLLPAAWVLLRHRLALARLEPAYLARLALIRAVLAGGR